MRLTGYSDRFSVRSGETLNFHVSATVPRYEAELVRVRHWGPNPGGPGLKEQQIAHPINRSYAGREQPVHTGSCVVVPGLPDLPAFTLGTWIWPTLPTSGERQGIFSRGTGRGFTLLIEADGCLALMCGTGDCECRVWRSRLPLLHRRWYFVAVVCDRTTGCASPFCAPRDYSPGFESVAPENASVPLGRRPFEDTPLLMGATGLRPDSARSSPCDAFNGKLADPALLARTLDTGSLREWCEQGTPLGAIARWDLYREHGSTIAVDPVGAYAALVRFPNKSRDPEITRYLAHNRMGSLYDVHRDGSGRCMSSMHRPLCIVPCTPCVPARRKSGSTAPTSFPPTCISSTGWRRRASPTRCSPTTICTRKASTRFAPTSRSCRAPTPSTGPVRCSMPSTPTSSEAGVLSI